MRDLKGSSALEQDAAVILLLWRPKPNGTYVRADEVIVEKNREGVANTVPVLCRGNLMRFDPREEVDSAER